MDPGGAIGAWGGLQGPWGPPRPRSRLQHPGTHRGLRARPAHAPPGPRPPAASASARARPGACAEPAGGAGRACAGRAAAGPGFKGAGAAAALPPATPPATPGIPRDPAMGCGGFACSRNALCALNVVYVVSGAAPRRAAGGGRAPLPGVGPVTGGRP